MPFGGELNDSLVSILAEPNGASGANIHAFKMVRKDRDKFNEIVDLHSQATPGFGVI